MTARLEPESRYQIWSALRMHNVFLTDVVLADEDWLVQQNFIVLRAEAHFVEENFAAVLDDCEEWHKSYPHLRTCDELKFRALDKLGRGSEVLAEIRRLWEADPYDGNIAWGYLSRLSGKDGCKELLRVLDAESGLIRFNAGQYSKAERRRIDCVVELDYRNRFDDLVEGYLSEADIDESLLEHVIRTLKVQRTATFSRLCIQNQSKWEGVLGRKVPCP